MKLTLAFLTHLKLPSFYMLLECTLVMCFFKISCSVHDFSQNLHLYSWILMWTLQYCILKVREGGIRIIYEVNTFPSPTLEITISLFANENALWLCVSINDLFQYLIFHEPFIWMLESSCELFCILFWKLENGSIKQDYFKKHNLSVFSETHKVMVISDM